MDVNGKFIQAALDLQKEYNQKPKIINVTSILDVEDLKSDEENQIQQQEVRLKDHAKHLFTRNYFVKQQSKIRKVSEQMVKKLNPKLQEKIQDQEWELRRKSHNGLQEKKLEEELKSLKRKMMGQYSSEQVELLNEPLILQLNKKLGRVSKAQLETKRIENLNKSIQMKYREDQRKSKIVL